MALAILWTDSDMVFSLTCKCELAKHVGCWRFKRLFGLVPRWRRGSCSVTASRTWTRTISRRRLVLARLATLASPTPDLSTRRMADLPMRLLLTMTDVNIQGHRGICSALAFCGKAFSRNRFL